MRTPRRMIKPLVFTMIALGGSGIALADNAGLSIPTSVASAVAPVAVGKRADYVAINSPADVNKITANTKGINVFYGSKLTSENALSLLQNLKPNQISYIGFSSSETPMTIDPQTLSAAAKVLTSPLSFLEFKEGINLPANDPAMQNIINSIAARIKVIDAELPTYQTVAQAGRKVDFTLTTKDQAQATLTGLLANQHSKTQKIWMSGSADNLTHIASGLENSNKFFDRIGWNVKNGFNAADANILGKFVANTNALGLAFENKLSSDMTLALASGMQSVKSKARALSIYYPGQDTSGIARVYTAFVKSAPAGTKLELGGNAIKYEDLPLSSGLFKHVTFAQVGRINPLALNAVRQGQIAAITLWQPLFEGPAVYSDNLKKINAAGMPFVSYHFNNGRSAIAVANNKTDLSGWLYKDKGVTNQTVAASDNPVTVLAHTSPKTQLTLSRPLKDEELDQLSRVTFPYRFSSYGDNGMTKLRRLPNGSFWGMDK